MLWKALKGQIRSDSQFIITGLILLVVLIGGPFLWSQWGTEPKFDVFRSVVLNVGAAILSAITLLTARNVIGCVTDRVYLRLAIPVRRIGLLRLLRGSLYLAAVTVFIWLARRLLSDDTSLDVHLFYHAGTMMFMNSAFPIVGDALSRLTGRGRIIWTQILFAVCALMVVSFHWGVKGLFKPYFNAEGAVVLFTLIAIASAMSILTYTKRGSYLFTNYGEV